MTNNNKKDELAELKARIDELERAAKPPEPYIDDWVPPPPAIDRVSMHPSTMMEFARAVPDSVIRDIVQDNRAPQGPSSAGASGQITKVSTSPGIPGSGTGWVNSSPLTPPAGLRWVDQQLDAQDRKDRETLIEQEALRRLAEKSK